MYILTQTSHFENSQDNVIHVKAAELEKKYLEDGYKKHVRYYKIEYQHKEYIIECPEFNNDKKDSLPMLIVIIPEFLIPRRRYPVYVYLFAIDLYSRQSQKGQRWAAKITREKFGLSSFAHTTLGRALKSFTKNISAAIKTPPATQSEPEKGEKKERQPHEAAEKENAEQTNKCKRTTFPTVSLTKDLRDQAVEFLKGKLNNSALQKVIESSQAIARAWFKEFHRFLI